MKKTSKIFAAILILSATLSCGGGSGGSPPSQRPVLYNLAISLNDFDFTALKADNERNPYIAFGAPFKDTFLNATFEYYPNAGSTVVSPVSGTIIELEYDENPGDYSMSIEAPNASDWKIIIDHVLEPTIKIGDSVTAGQSLGVAGVWEKSFGRTELQIFNNNDKLSYCPAAFLSSEVSSLILDELTAFMRSWMDFIGNQSAYEIEKMNPAGCLAEKVQG